MAANALNRQFTVTEPHGVWAGDSTDSWTAAGWVYLAVVLVLYSRALIVCHGVWRMPRRGKSSREGWSPPSRPKA